ncbi:MAG: hypothetical protein K8R21_03385 [Leptospira sp.]|nr:hypothetical protein [Leptospira sp.]
MMHKKFFMAIFIFLWLPPVFTLIQSYSGYEFLKLDGYFPEPEEPVFSVSGFTSGKFQRTTEKYLNQKSGLRAIFVRLRNQLHFTLFRKIHSQKTIFGKKEFLFEKDHIEAHLGIDYSGDEEIRKTILTLKETGSILAKKNIPLLVVLAPGKASFYPDLIPDEMQKQKKPDSNYSRFSKELSANGISYIDYISWMKSLSAEDKTEYYPKGGTHWSYFTASMAMPILSKKISEKMQRKMIHPEIKVKDSHKLPFYSLDSDIFNALNLLWSQPWGRYVEPEISYNHAESFRPNVLLVGDSFYFTLSATGIPRKIFSEKSAFWYYDKNEYINDGRPQKELGELDLDADIYSRNIVIILVSEVNLKKFGYGFPERIITAEQNRNRKSK